MKQIVNFIKSVFAQGGQSLITVRPSAQVYPTQLSTYIADNVDKRFEGRKMQLVDELHSIRTYLEDLATQLADLETLELQNANIPERAKHVMEGNRKSYLTRHKPLIRLDVPDNPNFEKIISFINGVEKELEIIKQSTGKNHRVLAEFFKNELRSINSTLKEVETSNERIRKMCSARPDELALLSAAQKEVDSFLEAIEAQGSLAQQLVDLEAAQKETEDEQEALQTSIEKFKKDPDFAALSGLESSRSDLESQMQRLGEELRQRLQPLDRALRKYMHQGMEHTDLVELYLDSPLRALEEDSHLQFLDVLTKVRNLVQQNQIELKEKEKEKTLTTISSVNREYMRRLMDQQKQLAEKKLEVDKKLRLSNVMREYEEMTYKLDHLSQKLGRYDEEVESTRKRLKKVDLENTKARLEETLSNTLEVDLTITL